MTVADRSAHAIFEALQRAGFPPKALGIERIDSDEALATLWARAIARSGRRTLPLELGLTLPLGAMEIVDYLAAASETVGAALTVTQQVFPLVAPEVQLLLERARGGSWRVAIVDHPPFPGQAESDLLVLGVLLGRLRQLASRPLQCLAVDLLETEHTPARWRQLLGVPRVHFGARRTALHLSASDWAIPLRSADPRLLEMLRGLVGAERRSTDALLVSVRALLRDRLPRPLLLREAATALGLSHRTLQRRLTERRTSLTGLSDEARRERAEQLFREGHLTLSEIASRIGFDEPASFTRAWRRWFGTTPTNERRHGRDISKRR